MRKMVKPEYDLIIFKSDLSTAIFMITSYKILLKYTHYLSNEQLTISNHSLTDASQFLTGICFSPNFPFVTLSAVASP